MDSYNKVKENWRVLQVDTPETLRYADEALAARLQACGQEAQRLWDTLRKHKTSHSPALFRDMPLVQSNDMTMEYRNLHRLTLGWATSGTGLYQNEALLQDILWALEWMYSHYYGKAVLEDRGWRSWKEYNWWDWQIGTPTPLMDTMVLIDQHLSLQQKRDYLAVFDSIVLRPVDWGSNKVNFGRLIASAGILTERPERVLSGTNDIADTFLYVDDGANNGQGFYRDGSYVFHNRHPMNGMYGMEHFGSAVRFASMLAGSEFEMAPEKIQLLCTWLYDSFLPFYWKGSVSRTVLGRDAHSEKNVGYWFLRNVVELYGLCRGEEKEEIAALLQGLVREHPCFANEECDAFFETLTLHQYVQYREAMRRKVSPYDVGVGTRVYYNMDRVVHRGRNSAYSLAMSSSRIYNYESINNQNKNGWYHGDGMLLCYADPFQYDETYWENVDPYRIPGTTTDNRPRKELSVSQCNEYLSGQDFVGGLSTGSAGVAAMQLESYHGDGALVSDRYYRPGGEYGGLPEQRNCSLMAKKAWFFMEDLVVCLGADIHAQDDAPVYTVVENRKERYAFQQGHIVGNIKETICINGEAKEVGDTDETVLNVQTLTLGEVSYCTFAPQNLTLRRTKSGFTEVLWQHGINPKGGKYAYLIFPKTDKQEVIRHINNMPVTVLENNKNVQMIRDLSGNRYGVFWQAGECGGIRVSQPLIVAVLKDSLCVCDPTGKVNFATVTVNGKQYDLDLQNCKGATRNIPL